MSHAQDALEFPCGRSMNNRFMLAPMTNLQSHDDGTLSDDEYRWLEMRARGGFGATMTCAAHVQADGQCWPGQLGVFDDRHLEGLTRLAAGIRAHGSISLAQLFHGGIRVPSERIGGRQPVGASDDEETGARALTRDEIEEVIESFIAAAVRCERAGFDGVELHGAHGYLLCQFLSAETNRRTDEFGGSAENRERLLRRIIAGVRERCRDDFCLGVRLSMERHGLVLRESLDLAAALMAEGHLDFLDVSLWDVFKAADDEDFASRPLLEWVAELPRHGVPLGVAGKIGSAEDVRRVMDAGVDLLLVGRAAILHHDFPKLVRDDATFTARSLPVTRAVLRDEGLSETFVNYMSRWPNFVAEDPE